MFLRFVAGQSVLRVITVINLIRPQPIFHLDYVQTKRASVVFSSRPVNSEVYNIQDEAKIFCVEIIKLFSDCTVHYLS